MITRDEIIRLAQKYQTTQLNIRREYMQHLFLRYFYLHSHTDRLFFKGGTALRILFQSPRFSEDLDFSSTHSDIAGLEKVILDTLSDMEKEGIAADLKEAKRTSGGYLCRISFKVYMDIIEVLLHISLRMKKAKGEVVTVVSDFMPAFSLMALDREQLVGEKMQAMLIRRKSRDFYDLYFILRANLLSPKGKKILPKVSEVLKSVNLNFEKELKQFLPRSHWAILKNFKKTLLREVERFI